MGRSKAQDELMERLEWLYPYSSIVDEVYIGDLIEERGDSVAEIAEELGFKPHKMFADIVLREADRTVVFEYHGQQHYSLVGNMTKNMAELAASQKRDREKSWILSRIGVPLVAVPYDMYVDAATIEAAIDEATSEMASARAELSACCECGRLFPASAMSAGMCSACKAQTLEEADERRRDRYDEFLDEQRARARERAGEDDDEVAERKAEDRARRKAAYRAYKESDEYKRRKEEQKRLRKEAYQRQKEARRTERRKRRRQEKGESLPE